jgi:hypothetical protein
VGVITGVGNVVGVTVGGNQIVVGVIVAVAGTVVSVGNGVGVSVAEHATHNNKPRQIGRRFFIARLEAIS